MLRTESESAYVRDDLDAGLDALRKNVCHQARGELGGVFDGLRVDIFEYKVYVWSRDLWVAVKQFLEMFDGGRDIMFFYWYIVVRWRS